MTLTLSPSSISENGGESTVTATLSHPSSAATTVTVGAVSGFYTVGSDTTIEIAAGETANATDTVLVTAANDDVHQGTAGRSTTVTGTAANAQATAESETVTVTGAALTLTDDEDLPEVTLALSPSSIDEHDGTNPGSSTVTATLDRASSEAVTLTVSALAGGGDRLHAVECEHVDHRGRADGERGDGDDYGGEQHDGCAGQERDGLGDGGRG